MINLNEQLARMRSEIAFEPLTYISNRRAKFPTRLTDEQCDICGEYHEGDVPRDCETGDGI